MTLDEAIRHCEDVVEEKEAICNVIENEGETWTDSGKTHYDICKKCAEEHRQLAEWLKELKRLKEQEPILNKIRDEIEELDEYYDNDYFSGNKDAMYKCNEVLQIIDKYKAESED